MANGKFVSYLRVSTGKQGRSGLGLEGQRQAVATYLNGGSWQLLAEFVEVEAAAGMSALSLRRPWRSAGRTALPSSSPTSRALPAQSLSCPNCSPPMSRYASLTCRRSRATGKFLLHQMASVAELEAGMISDRTKKALGAARCVA